MAKAILTLEDTADGATVIVSLDMTSAQTNGLGAPRQTSAVRMAQTLFGMASSEETLRAIPACSRQPSPPIIH